MRWKTALVALAGIWLLAACGTDSSTKKEQSDKLTVVTTFYPMYEFTKQVVGDLGEVELLIPAGTEPHDYEPSAKDVAKITDADVFVYNSNALESWAPDVTADTQGLAIEAAEKIELTAGQEHEEEGEADDHDHSLDPHVWLDPVLAIKEVETIRDALSAQYPDDKPTFTANADAYIKKLQELDAAYTAAFKNASNRTFVTQHAAFGYLAKQYGLTQEAVSGLSPDEEPTASRLAELKQFVEKNQVQIIYFEENASSKVAETLASETGVSLKVLNPLESLTKEQIKNGSDYLSVMKDNLAALQETIK